jgi:hypothetical protein
MNAPTLDPDQLAVVERYRTCEFATMSRAGVPIAWPISPLRQPDGTFLVTTSIALPQKAFNVRRDPRVALLFSDPTASGLDGAPELLVQGTASCPDEILTGPAGAEELWRRLYERQPASRAYSANAVSRQVMDWYYMRLHITTTPTAISTRPPLPAGAASTAGPLAGFASAVLGTLDADGMPTLLRVGLGAATDEAVTVEVPDGAEVRPGPASLLAHSHDERLWNLRRTVLLGDLRGAEGAWTFEPTRSLGGEDNSPLTVLRGLVTMRRAAARYLARRDLPRPRIAWAEFKALAAPGQGSQPTRPESAA